MKKRFDIGIVGAGLIGSALALWLNKHTDYSVCLLERQALMSKPELSNERVVALGGLALNYLDDIGVLECLGVDAAYSYTQMRIWDDNSDGELSFESSLIDRDSLGSMVDSLMCNYHLQQAVLNSGVTSFFGVDISELEQSDDKSSLVVDPLEGETGSRLDFDLIIAADGARSWLRQSAKIFANRQPYEQRGIVAVIETQESHQDCAWQAFLDTGPVAVLPLANNRSSIVWSAENSRADELMNLTDVDFEVVLTQALQNRLGSATLCSSRQSFPLNSVQAERYFAGRVVLVGDAAHSIHPMAGQGANLGFKDALALGELLRDSNRSTLSSPRVLSRYQAKRQGDNLQTDALMSALHHIYRAKSPMFMLARGLGMSGVNASSNLRKALVRQAIGA